MSEWLDGVLVDVRHERDRQEAKWGENSAVNLSLFDGLPVLVEEVGEVAEAMLDVRWRAGDPGKVYDELIQVAAVAVAMAESVLVDGETGR